MNAVEKTEGEATVIQLGDLIAKNWQTYLKYQAAFRQIFSVYLSTYWDKLTGFDIVGFDERYLYAQFGRYDARDDKSMADLIKEKFGDKAVDLISLLIDPDRKDLPHAAPDPLP